MNILITGSSGQIGSNVGLALLKRGDRVTRTALLELNASADMCLLYTSEPFATRVITMNRRYTEIRVGERVYAIGCPSGLDLTLSEGLVSGLRRKDGIAYVQTSASISPGSSGGALLDEYGNLIGITSFYLKDAQNLNFAISVDEYLTALEATTGVSLR